MIGFGLIGWLAPSSIPVIDGKSLTGLFFESIGTELAHFPTPPALTSQFWSVPLSFFQFCYTFYTYKKKIICINRVYIYIDEIAASNNKT